MPDMRLGVGLPALAANGAGATIRALSCGARGWRVRGRRARNRGGQGEDKWDKQIQEKHDSQSPLGLNRQFNWLHPSMRGFRKNGANSFNSYFLGTGRTSVPAKVREHRRFPMRRRAMP